MSQLQFPRELRQLLETDLTSVEKLEAVRCVRSTRRPLAWGELVGALGLGRDEAQGAIADLVRAGFLARAGDHIGLGPRAAGPAFEALVRVYEADRTLIVSELSAISVERIRGMAARAFGGALGGKKKPEGGQR